MICFSALYRNHPETSVEAPKLLASAVIIAFKRLAMTVCCLSVVMTGYADPPTIGAIADQTAVEDVPIVPIYMDLNDAELPVISLQLSAVSSDTNTLPNENLVFQYFQYNANGFLPGWYLTVTPAFGVTNGSSTVTVTCSDGTDSTNASFLFTVTPPPPGSARFANLSPILIPDGIASPYPSTINVSGMAGSVTNITLVLSKFSHQNVSDVNALLVAPGGQGAIALSHVSGSYNASNVTVAVTGWPIYFLPLAQNYPLWSEMPLLPTAYGSVVFPAPAPANSFGSSFSAFNRLNPNGTWSLYVYDDAPANTGQIAGGWSLTIATSTNASLQLETQPDGSGIVVSAHNITMGSSNIVYAVKRDAFGAFITNVAASWLLTNITGGVLSSDLQVASNSKSATFTGNSLGSADIHATYNDNGIMLSADSGTLTVVSATSPTIGSLTNQSVYEDQPTELIQLPLSDPNVALDQILLTAASSNLQLIPVTNIFFYANGLGSGLKRYISMTPVFGQTGTTTITVTANDGVGSATNSFVLTVNPPPPGAGRFANTNGIMIPIEFTATPYPSQIVVSNMSGTITNVTVTLSQFTHAYPGDVDMLLVNVSPDQHTNSVVIFSRAGDGGTAISGNNWSANNITLTLSDAAVFALPFPGPLISTPFRPANYSSATNGGPALFPAPAPDPSFYTNTPVAMSRFNGLSANGTWLLYVYDYAPPDGGIIAAWSLMINTLSGPAKITITSITFVEKHRVLITGTGGAGVAYSIQASTNVINWQRIGAATAGANGVFSFKDTKNSGFKNRFYRVVFP
jgi:subtilisin-like proprotein convertase family protein